MASRDMHLRYHRQSCRTCRYFRIHIQPNGTAASDCLLLGRMLGISNNIRGEWFRFSPDEAQGVVKWIKAVGSNA